MPIIFGKNIDRKENKIFKVLFVFVFMFFIFFCAKMSTAYAADRYWVGNSGNINDPVHWSETDGGTGGASVPGPSDTVYITALSLGGYLSTISVNVGTTFDSLIISSLDSRLDLILSADLTINTSATFSGADTNTKRLLVASNNIGVERIITVPSASVTASNVDFRDIRFANAVDLSAISGGSGDAGGNSGITFTQAQPQWFKHTSGSASWNDTTKWYRDQAKTIQGRVPLPQDDATFDAGSFTGTSTLSVNVSRMGRSLDMSAVDDAVTMTLANVVENHGSFVLGNNVTPNYLYGFKLMGRGSFVLNLFNKPVNFFNSYAHNGTYTNQSNLILTTTNSMFYIYNGTFDFNDFNVSGPGLMRSAVGTTIYCGNGTFSSTYNSTSSVIGFGGTNYFEGSTFKFEPAGGSSNMSVSGTISYNKLWLSGSSTGNFDFTNSGNSFNELIIDPGRKVRFPANKTQQVEKLTALGTASEHITITSVTSATHTLNYTGDTNVVADYLDLSYSIGTPADKWYASNSVNEGNNSGWTLANPPDAPTGLTPTSGVSEISLSWTVPAWDGGIAITDYVVDYKLSSDSTWNTFADPISALTTLTVTGLTNGLSYDFRVSAVNVIGQGLTSATASSTPINPLDRYWVGGTGNWSDTSHWSNTDGGAGGQTAPTSENNVYFSAESLSADGAVVTLDTVANTNSLDFSGLDQTMTLTSTANALNVYGSLSLSTKLSVAFTNIAYLYFKATTSVNITSNSNASNWNQIYFDGIGGKWTLQDDAVLNGTTKLYNGEFDTNSKNYTTNQIFGFYAGTSKKLTLGSSIVNLGNGMFFYSTLNNTVDAGTSTIKVTGDWFEGGGKTFYNVEINRTSNTINGTVGNFTAYNLSRTSGANILGNFPISSNITITNSLILTGNNETNYRLLMASNTIGTQRTITVDPAKVTASNVDFRDIKFQNPIDLSGISGDSGDAGGNSGITFTTAQPQWFKHTSGAVSWSDSTKWYQDQAKTIQGRVPLPQDDATFDADSFTGTSTLTVNAPRIGRSLDMSAVDDAVTMTLANTIESYGSYILGNNITPSGNFTLNLMGRSNFNFSSNGKNMYGVSINSGNYTNLSNINFTGTSYMNRIVLNPNAVLIPSFDFNDFNAVMNVFGITQNNVCNVYFGNGTIELKNADGSWIMSAVTSANIYAEGSTIKINTQSGNSNEVLSLAGKSFNKIWLSGSHTGNFDITGSNTIAELIIDPGRKVRFTAGTTQQIGKLTAVGTADNPITISSITGATHTLNYTGVGNAIGDYLNLSYSTGTPANKWFASHYTDGGNNSGWTFANAPDAPTAVLLTAGNTQVSLSWSAPGFDGGTVITDYAIDYKLSTEPTTWLTFSDGESTLTTAVVTGLTNGLSYDFRISAMNLIGQGTPSTTSTVTPLTVPGAPISVTAVRGNAEATVTFFPPLSDGGSTITNYTVTSNPESHTASGLTSPIIVTGLMNGTAYTFTVTATNLAGTGPASDPSNSVTPATIPDAPTTPIATAGNGQVNLSWTAPVWNGGAVVTDYVIDYKLSSEPTIWLTFVDGTSSEITGIVTGLTNGLSYDFRISAVNDVGQGSPSVETSAMPVTVPNAPTEVSAIPANAQATVSFTPPVFDGGSTINSYKVTSSPGGFNNTGGASPIVVTGLSNGTSYTFTVTAINAIGESLPSVASTPVTPVTVPNAPTEVIATEGNSQASVTFTPPAFDGGTPITSYTVTSSPGNFTGTGIDLPIIVTGLTNGNTYTFTVTATNAVGVGPASSPSNEVTLSIEPGAPVNLASTVLGSSIGLSWSEPISNGGNAINDYIIEYQLTTGGVWAIFSDGQNLNTTATVTGLSNGVSYDFRVKAVNNVGPGLPSGTTTATPGEPAQVIIQNFSDLTVSDIGTNIRITNEGSVEYEYQYTWCITDSAENLCGGGNDIFSATAAKLIDHGENWDTTLISNVFVPGNYYFHIVVFYGSESSNAYQSFTALATYPNSPTSPVAVAGNANAVVSFDIPIFDGGSPITSYTVTSNPGGLTGNGTSSPITVQGLTNGNTYTFTVTATNAVGTSPASLVSNSVTPLTVPDPPTGLSAEALDGQVALTWISPVNNGGSAITDYVVEYKLTNDLVWVIFSDGISSNTTATVTGLTNNLSYDFRVSAVNIVGQSLVNQTSATLPSVNNGGNSGGSSGSYIRPQIISETIIPGEIIPEEIPVNENIYPVEVKPKTDKKPTKNEETSKSNNISSENIDPNTNDNVVSITPVKNPTMKDIPKDILEPDILPIEKSSGLGEVAKMIIKIGGIAMASGGIMYFGFLGIKKLRVKNKLKNQEEKSPIRKI